MEQPIQNLVIVDSTLDTNVQAAVNKAKVAPGAAVWVPTSYPGTDTVASPGVPVYDNRGTGIITVGTVTAAAATIASPTKIANMSGTNPPVTATTGGVFTPTLNLPGSGAFEQVPFRVKAAGWVSLNGGTYTATVQPLIYASASLGFTASAAAAILSATAANVTVAVAAAATLTYFPWEVELTLEGDTTSGIMTGRAKGSLVTTSAAGRQPVSYPTTAANNSWDAIVGANSPSALSFTATAAPVQFLVGVTLGGATVSAGVVNLGSFYITS